jgi:hypothetical protein
VKTDLQVDFELPRVPSERVGLSRHALMGRQRIVQKNVTKQGEAALANEAEKPGGTL